MRCGSLGYVGGCDLSCAPTKEGGWNVAIFAFCLRAVREACFPSADGRVVGDEYDDAFQRGHMQGASRALSVNIGLVV